MVKHPNQWKHKLSVARTLRQKDINDVAELHRQGLTHREIAARKGKPMVWAWRRMQEAFAIWREDTAEAAGTRAEQIRAQLDFVYREAVAAWERSKVEQQRKRAKKRTGPKKNEAGDLVEVSSEEEIELKKRDGDPRHLDVALRSREKLMRLWGLDKQTHELSGDGGPVNLFQLLLQAPAEPAVVVGEDGEEHVIEVESVPLLPSGDGDGECDGFEDA